VSHATVRAILEGRLNTWATGTALRVAWENVPFSPAQGETYVRAFMLPAETVSQDLKGDHRRYLGVFQVSIVTPINSGPGAALALVDSLNTQFPMNGRYTSGAVTVQIVGPASPAPAIQEESNFVIPVSIRYRCDTI
jgi:hypothetical protein